MPFLMAAGWELDAEICTGLGNEIVLIVGSQV